MRGLSRYASVRGAKYIKFKWFWAETCKIE